MLRKISSVQAVLKEDSELREQILEQALNNSLTNFKLAWLELAELVNPPADVRFLTDLLDGWDPDKSPYEGYEFKQAELLPFIAFITAQIPALKQGKSSEHDWYPFTKKVLCYLSGTKINFESIKQLSITIDKCYNKTNPTRIGDTKHFRSILYTISPLALLPFILEDGWEPPTEKGVALTAELFASSIQNYPHYTKRLLPFIKTDALRLGILSKLLEDYNPYDSDNLELTQLHESLDQIYKTIQGSRTAKVDELLFNRLFNASFIKSHPEILGVKLNPNMKCTLSTVQQETITHANWLSSRIRNKEYALKKLEQTFPTYSKHAIMAILIKEPLEIALTVHNKVKENLYARC